MASDSPANSLPALEKFEGRGATMAQPRWISHNLASAPSSTIAGNVARTRASIWLPQSVYLSAIGWDTFILRVGCACLEEFGNLRTYVVAWH